MGVLGVMGAKMTDNVGGFSSDEMLEVMSILDMKVIGPRRKKTCLQGLRLSEIQTSLLSYRD